MFKNKNILITGGTGSFGTEVLKKLLTQNCNEIRIFSRDEKKQDDMRRNFNSSNLKFYIGDVRDINSINNAIKNIDFVFHAAALKQVPSCEFYPLEAIKTNVLGTENVLEAGINNKVKKIVCLSTDKAVYPINAMGASKAMMEKVAIAKSRNTNKTIINITRYGNVMASRGSVIPLFIEQINNNIPISITDPNMTRFMMTLKDAVDLVFFAFKNGKPGEIYVQKSPASTINVLVKSLLLLLNKPNHKINIIGTRHGEKLYESLLTREEHSIATNLGNYYCVPPDLRQLNYGKYFEYGEKKISTASDYNSQNTQQLNIKEMILLLKKLPEIQNLLKDDFIS